jgi:hypothetical protein
MLCMKSRQEEAAYAARTIRAFLNGSGGDWDWDDFTSCSLRNVEVDHLRRRAAYVELPVDDDGREELIALAGEADLLAGATDS